MSSPNQARVELGTAGHNIAGNIDVYLPQLANRGAEVAKAANQIHERVLHLREISREFMEGKGGTIQPVAFDKCAQEIQAILPQFSGHGKDVDAIANAINGYCNQLNTVHAQHLHLVDENAPLVAGQPVVNNGIGGGPFETGSTPATDKADTKGIDPNPQPAGTGTASVVVSTGPGTAAVVGDAGAAAAAKAAFAPPTGK